MKKRFLFIVATILTLTMATASVISGCGCAGPTTSEATSDEAVQIETKIETVTEIATDAQGNTHIEEATEIVKVETNKSDSEKSENEKSENNNSESSQADEKNNSSSSSSKTEEKTSKTNSSTSSSKTNSSTKNSSTSKNKENTSAPDSSSSKTNNSLKNNNSSSSKTNTNKNNTSSSSTKSESSKVEETKHTHSWVDITKQVKVIDQEAYTYEEPVYEKQSRAICKKCGADITDNIDHIFDCDSSYKVTWINIQVGTKTVEVPEQSHYETKTTGRKCSSCGEVEYY